MAQQVFSFGQQETHVTLTVFKDVVRRMTSMPGQRIVVLVSPGFISPDEYQSDKSEIIDRAIKSNVVINSLDARGLWTDPMLDASQTGKYTVQYQIAKQAGRPYGGQRPGRGPRRNGVRHGRNVFHNNNDLNQGMRRTWPALRSITMSSVSRRRT